MSLTGILWFTYLLNHWLTAPVNSNPKTTRIWSIQFTTAPPTLTHHRLLMEGASFLYAISMGLPGMECANQALCKAPGPCDPMEILNSPQSGPVLHSLLLVQFYTIYLKTKKKNSLHKFQDSLHPTLFLCQRSGWFPHPGYQSYVAQALTNH